MTKENYIELYKKYRPRTFEDVKGQDTIVKSLKASVVNGKIPTGYLFSGTAGTGKTSVAMILAKALNCENRHEDGNPCNECATCKAIDNMALPGIKYISMANAGSAEDVRNLMEESRVSQPIKKKVFILDEVHNLSSAAQDAMLIALESEKQSTLFICCTTDPDKIKPAILSRLQQRTFRKLDNQELINNLLGIIKKEPWIVEILKPKDVDDKEAKELAKRKITQCALMAGGSVRNSISNLETLISSGTLPTEYSLEILKAITSGNVLNVYKVMEEANNASVDFNKTAEQVYRSLVDILKGKAGIPLDNRSLVDITNKLSGKTTQLLLKEMGNILKLISNRVIDYKILYEICFVTMSQIYKKTEEK